MSIARLHSHIHAWQLRVAIPAAFLVYVVLASLACCRSLAGQATVYDYGYGFGGLVQSIVVRHTYASAGGFFTGHRMPLVPYFLSAVALITPDGLAVVIAKNVVFFALTAFACLLVWNQVSVNQPHVALAALSYLALFPSLVRHATAPDTEEGYLIHVLALLFACLLFFDSLALGARPLALGGLALLNAALFLTKSGMLPATVVLGLGFYLRSRRSVAVLATFALVLGLAVLFWASLNWVHSSRFTFSTSWDGRNFYKGNNEHALRLYPIYNLDILERDNLLALPRVPDDEWDYDHMMRRQALNFLATRPADAINLLARKSFVFFLDVRPIPISDDETLFGSVFSRANLPFQLLFRLLLLLAGWRAFADIRRAWSARGGSWDPCGAHCANAIVFLVVTLAYALPYLVGFAYERHVMPLVAPTVFYLLWLSAEPSRLRAVRT